LGKGVIATRKNSDFRHGQIGEKIVRMTEMVKNVRHPHCFTVFAMVKMSKFAIFYTRQNSLKLIMKI
jgi:hypothetical protein